jgi:hypothetical protein
VGKVERVRIESGVESITASQYETRWSSGYHHGTQDTPNSRLGTIKCRTVVLPSEDYDSTSCKSGWGPGDQGRTCSCSTLGCRAIWMMMKKARAPPNTSLGQHLGDWLEPIAIHCRGVKTQPYQDGVLGITKRAYHASDILTVFGDQEQHDVTNTLRSERCERAGFTVSNAAHWR